MSGRRERESFVADAQRALRALGGGHDIARLDLRAGSALDGVGISPARGPAASSMMRLP